MTAPPRASSSNPLYEQVADRIAKLIQQGTLRAGDRIPSVRQLRSQLGVSVSTVLEAYRLLESEGLIEARPQSGYYVRITQGDLPPEPSISTPGDVATVVGVGSLVSEILAAARDPDRVPLGASGASPLLLPTLKLNQILAKVARHAEPSTNLYDLPPGNETVRRRIARRSLGWGGSLTAEDLIITCGCMEAINLCLKAVARPGDTIAIESPVFYGFLQILESLGMKALEIPTHPRDGVSLTALEAAIQTHSVKACLFTPSFSNPLGCCMPEEKRQQLAELLRRSQIPLIEDDIFGELYFGDRRPKPVKAFDTEGWVLLCSSFSKDLAPGYRVGWTAPGRFNPLVQRLKHASTIANPTLPQLAIAEFLQSSGYDHHLRQLRKAYAAQTQQVIQAIGQFFPEGTKVTRPQGGFLLWVELPEAIDSLALYRQAMEQKISIVPGLIFSASQKYQNCIRLNCGNPWSEELEKGLATLGHLAWRLQP
ncbi:PLP-dependent aminotransferase family protein [Phormidium tenue FACHB-886]|nr:PLP-dependent aminotransferase family protein [Phormidium tenue FACHB-886]